MKIWAVKDANNDWHAINLLEVDMIFHTKKSLHITFKHKHKNNILIIELKTKSKAINEFDDIIEFWREKND